MGFMGARGKWHVSGSQLWLDWGTHYRKSRAEVSNSPENLTKAHVQEDREGTWKPIYEDLRHLWICRNP